MSTYFFLETLVENRGWRDCCVCVCCVWKEVGEKMNQDKRVWGGPMGICLGAYEMVQGNAKDV